MIIGTVNVTEKAVITHRDSYLVDSLSVVSVRRPFFGAALMLGFGFGGFGIAFLDLLYTGEIAIIGIASTLAVLLGAQVGQLKLLSRDLRGSELSGVIWGKYSSLNQIRSDIVTQLSAKAQGGVS